MGLMARKPNSSKQTQMLLSALLDAGDDWRHGYDLSRQTGLKSGTLYPVLIRLEQQGWLEAQWEDEAAPGKPRRHLYRLTALGAQEAKRARDTHRTSARPVLQPAVEGGAE
jgi:DNA-binding PadR family transcriptional regulator